MFSNHDFFGLYSAPILGSFQHSPQAPHDFSPTVRVQYRTAEKTVDSGPIAKKALILYKNKRSLQVGRRENSSKILGQGFSGQREWRGGCTRMAQKWSIFLGGRSPECGSHFWAIRVVLRVKHTQFSSSCPS